MPESPLVFHLRVPAVHPARHWRTACGDYGCGPFWGHIACPPEWSHLVNCPECLEYVHA